MIVTAIEIKNASVSSGIMPRIVVAAASMTGRIRATPESTTASKGFFSVSICRSISSIRTMAFLIIIPIRARNPSRGMKPNGC